MAVSPIRSAFWLKLISVRLSSMMLTSWWEGVRPARRDVESKGNLKVITSQKLSLGHLGMIKAILISTSSLSRGW
jgi:hypothetical protein